MKHNSSLGFFVAFLRLFLFAWSFHSLLPFFLLILIPSHFTCILFFVFNVYIFLGTFLLVSLCYFSYSCEDFSLALQYSFHSTLCFKIFIYYLLFFVSFVPSYNSQCLMFMKHFLTKHVFDLGLFWNQLTLWWSWTWLLKLGLDLELVTLGPWKSFALNSSFKNPCYICRFLVWHIFIFFSCTLSLGNVRLNSFEDDGLYNSWISIYRYVTSFVLDIGLEKANTRFNNIY
jgi:hypothetical protein